MVTVLIIAGGLALVLLLVGVVLSVSGERTLVDDRLNKYLEDEQKKDVDKDAKSALTEWANKRVEKSSMGKRSLATWRAPI